MFKILKDSEPLAQIRDFLQTTDPKARLVTYYALGEYLVTYLVASDATRDEAAIRASIRNLVYELNELAIIDKTLMEKIFNNILGYKLFLFNSYGQINSNLLQATCFQDVLGITTYYATDDIHTINTHFELFRRVVVTTIALINQHKDIMIKVNANA